MRAMACASHLATGRVVTPLHFLFILGSPRVSFNLTPYLIRFFFFFLGTVSFRVM